MDFPAPVTPSLIALAVSTAALLQAELSGANKRIYIFKPLASLSFLILAIACGAFTGIYGFLILGGLLFCALGDCLLLPEGAGKWFQRGVLAFMTGHGFYILASLSLWHPDVLRPVFLLMIALIIAAGYPLYKRLRGPDAEILIKVYIGVIALMIISAGYAGYISRIWILPIAAIMFAVSDIFVGRNRSDKSKLGQFWIITPLYFAAQALFATSIQYA